MIIIFVPVFSTGIDFGMFLFCFLFSFGYSFFVLFSSASANIECLELANIPFVFNIIIQNSS